MEQELELRGRALPRRGVLKAGGTPGGLRGGPFYITDAAYTVHLIQKGLFDHGGKPCEKTLAILGLSQSVGAM